MADEYIRREDAKIILQRAWIEDPFRRQEAFDELNSIPAADVRPVVRGKWVQVMGKYDWMVKCSRCNGVPLETSNFCPNCGADMREES